MYEEFVVLSIISVSCALVFVILHATQLWYWRRRLPNIFPCVKDIALWCHNAWLRLRGRTPVTPESADTPVSPVRPRSKRLVSVLKARYLWIGLFCNISAALYGLDSFGQLGLISWLWNRLFVMTLIGCYPVLWGLWYGCKFCT